MALDMNNFSTDMTEKTQILSDKKLHIGIIGTGGIEIGRASCRERV